MTHRKVETMMSVLLYLFSLFLLTEWMRPLSELTDIGDTYVFFLFIVLSLILHFLSVHWMARFALLGACLVVAIPFLHYDAPFWTFSWIESYVAEFILNATHIWSRDWFLLTDSFRTLLLFVMLWLVTYLIHYWVNLKSSMFLFFVITVLFLAVLDTFTPYDAGMAIIRVVVLGFAMMGMVTIFRLVVLEKLSLSSRLLGKWLISLAIMVACSTSLGIITPKFDPQWPDPVPFIQSFSTHATEGESSVSKVGYDEDDTKLGGTIQPDSSVVFYNTATTAHYWKVESKDVYTGKGWVSFIGKSVLFPNGEEWTEFENYETPKQVETKGYEASVSVIEDNHPILYPAGSFLKRVDADGVDTFLYNSSILKITPVTDNGEKQSVHTYTVIYEQPRYDIAELRKINAPDETMDVLMKQNTQLPDEMPDRVRDLALKLTENQSNWYDKAKAIENYFDKPEFVYSKEKIPYPAQNQDYVDQFLFETKMGYCDNFSTSMVVLLRAAGIPARWAKGYTEGERTSFRGDSVYEVTNNNAHSWVEVYFSGIGWVSFEPTKGFLGDTEFFNSEANVGEDTSVATTPEQKEGKQAEQELKKQEKTIENDHRTKVNLDVVLRLKWLVIGLIVVGIGAVGLYWTRRKWLPFLLIARLKGKTDGFSEAYEVLLKQLKRAGLKRSESQTLREYAAYIDSVYDTDKMTELTRRYEVMTYRGDAEGEAWVEHRDNWEYLMKKTSS